MTQLVQLSQICPYCESRFLYKHEGKTYSRLISVYSRERDRTIAYRCPDCGKEDAA